MSGVVPLRLPRLASLILSTAFGVIGMSVGINALVKSNHQKDFVRHHAPAGAIVHIDTSDVTDSGIVSTVGCGLLALVSTLFTPLLIHSAGSSVRTLSTRTLPIQTGVLAFLTLWLFACLVPFTDFVANRETQVTAFIGSTQLPDSVVKSFQQSQGINGVYHKIGYLRLSTIIQWIALFFALTSTILSFLAQRSVPASESTAYRRDTAVTEDTEKAEVKTIENAPEVSQKTV